MNGISIIAVRMGGVIWGVKSPSPGTLVEPANIHSPELGCRLFQTLISSLTVSENKKKKRESIYTQESGVVLTPANQTKSKRSVKK